MKSFPPCLTLLFAVLSVSSATAPIPPIKRLAQATSKAEPNIPNPKTIRGLDAAPSRRNQDNAGQKRARSDVGFGPPAPAKRTPPEENSTGQGESSDENVQEPQDESPSGETHDTEQNDNDNRA